MSPSEIVTTFLLDEELKRIGKRNKMKSNTPQCTCQGVGECNECLRAAKKRESKSVFGPVFSHTSNIIVKRKRSSKSSSRV